MAHGSKKVVLFALGANLAIALSKFVVYFLTGSSSMLSEAIHSTADTGNQVLLLVGMARSRKPEDQTHPFGYASERFFWAFLVAVQLFALGGLYSLWEGVKKVSHPHQIKNPFLAVGLLLFAMAAEGISFLKASSQLHRERGTLPIFSYLRKTNKVEVVVVYLEDMAALLGLTIALFSVLLSHFTGLAFFDGLGSILIGLLLIGVAFFLGSEMHSLIVGESAPEEVMREVERILSRQEGVERVVYLKSLILGENNILLAGKVLFPPTTPMEKVSSAIDMAEREIREKFPSVKKIFLEADVPK